MLNVGILGAGNIAEKMASTIRQMDDARVVAVGARDLVRAQAFAGRFGIPKAYGSYEQLAADEEVELIYIATPHSHHREHAILCLNAGKHVLCEKAFARTAAEAREMLALANEKKLLLTEAIWPRFMPMAQELAQLCSREEVGKVWGLSANLFYPVRDKERIQRPELAGGALLDIGIYPLTFASIVMGDDIADITTSAIMGETGVDLQNTMILNYKDGRQATLSSGVLSRGNRRGQLYCERGYIEVENINNFECIKIFDNDYQLVRKIDCPPQISGYEYEVRAAAKAIREGQLECPEMPQREIIYMMELMDTIRHKWDFWYPGEK